MYKKMEKLKEVKKPKRVHWATEANLRQLTIFRSQDCPSKVALGAPYDRQSRVANSNMVVSDGFLTSTRCPSKGRRYLNPSSSIEKVVPYIPLIPWKTPPEQINLSCKWRVAAGEESEETKVQMQRIVRELNAPRHSNFQLGSINAHHSSLDHIVTHYGHSPSISLDAEDQNYDDSKTPVIPIIAIDEAETMDLLSDESAAPGICFNSQAQNLFQIPSTSDFLDIPRSNSLPSPKPSSSEQFDLTTLQDLGDPAAATAIMQLKELCSLIDRESLRKLLSNPKMTEKLIEELRLSSSSTNGTSGPKEIELRPPLPNSQPSFLINKSTSTSGIPANFGTEAIHRPLMVKQSSAFLSKTIANATTAETGIASGRKPFEQPLHLLNSTPVSLAQESISKNIQQNNVEHEALTRSVNQQSTATGKFPSYLGAKLVTKPVSLPSSTSDLLTKNFISEYCEISDNRTASVMTSSVTLSSSTPDLLREESLLAVEHPSFRLASPLSGTGEPLRVNFQSKEFWSTASQASSFLSMRTSVSSPKDRNYFWSLIRQHGGAKNSSDAELSQYQRPYHSLQSLKPCKFHNSSKGCRNGSNCTFLHDMPPAPSRSDSVGGPWLKEDETRRGISQAGNELQCYMK